MCEETYGADKIVLQYVEEAIELLEKAARNAKESDSQGVRTKIVPWIWDTVDILEPLTEELFLIEEDENE